MGCWTLITHGSAFGEHSTTASKNLGFVPSPTVAALKKEVSDTAKKYDQQIQDAVDKWSQLKPQFWRPLDDALEQIKLYAEQH